MKRFFLSVFLLLAIFSIADAQHIIYADDNKSDVQRMNFEIIGKLANNYLIYKELKNNTRISVYDEVMHLVEEVPVTIFPQKASLLDVAFFPYRSHAYLIYQYQTGDIVYCEAARVEANGRILEQPTVLDTTHISYTTKGKIYNVITNNDKSRLLVFKINRRDRSLYKASTLLVDNSLAPLHRGQFTIPIDNEKGERLGGYSLSNDGDFIFTKYTRLKSGNIAESSLAVAGAGTDGFETYPIGNSIGIDQLFLDDIKIKVDDVNKRVLLASYFSQSKKGNIDGIYVAAFGKNGNRDFERTITFTEELKKKVKSRSSVREAFNNQFINQIITQDNGAFTISSEALYTSNNNWDRWGFWGPGMYAGWGFGPGWGWGGWGSWGWGPGWGGYWSPYYYYSPFYYRSYWWGGWGPWGGGLYDRGWSKFHADNVAILSFDKNGLLQSDNVIVKRQDDTETDGTISYQVMNTEDGTYFLLNNSGKVSELECIALGNDGSLHKSGSIEAKTKRLDFMPRYGKQVGSTEMIVPYLYKKNIGFSKWKL
ncbi:MAG: hypothetical protein QM727_13610 [Niabella sp.]